VSLPKDHVNSPSVQRARTALEGAILGKHLDFLSTPNGKKTASSLAFFWGLTVGELSAVYDEHGGIVYWIGPTSVLPSNAKSHQPAAP